MAMQPDGSRLVGANRRRVYEYIRTRPGLHLRRLQRDLGMALGTLEYHLWTMEKQGYVCSRRLGRVKAYYCTAAHDRRDKDYLYFLRQPMPGLILGLLSRRRGVSFQSLARRVPVSPSTLSFHLRKLTERGLLWRVRVGRSTVFGLEDPDRVLRLVEEYGASPTPPEMLALPRADAGRFMPGSPPTHVPVLVPAV